MERVFVWCFVFVLMMGLVCSQDSWESINVDGPEGVDSSGLGTEEQGEISQEVSSSFGQVSETEDEGDDPTFYKKEFYVALGVVAFVLVLLGFFVWLWLKGPKNKWRR